jgi:hypothetical protein
MIYCSKSTDFSAKMTRMLVLFKMNLNFVDSLLLKFFNAEFITLIAAIFSRR